MFYVALKNRMKQISFSAIVPQHRYSGLVLIEGDEIISTTPTPYPLICLFEGSWRVREFWR
jgi:hypothetical protein